MTDPTQRPIFVLTLMDLQDYYQFKHCLKSKRFQVLNLTEQVALEYLRTHHVSVVIYDNDRYHHHWRRFFAQTRTINNMPPKIIVASRHADERFWTEVLNVGGPDMDVLAIPFHKDELFIIASMDHHWRHPGGHPKQK